MNEPKSKQEKLDIHFLRMAWLNALDLSKDPATKVGAVIVTPDNRQLSMGYNGMPAGIEETDEMWERPEKYENVIHAEENAIINAPFDTVGCTIYTTIQPCHKCMGKLKNAGIKRIVYSHAYKRLTCKHIVDRLIPSFEFVQIDDPVCDMMAERMHDGFYGLIA